MSVCVCIPEQGSCGCVCRGARGLLKERENGDDSEIR